MTKKIKFVAYHLASTSTMCLRMMKRHESFKVYGKLSKMIYDSIDSKYSKKHIKTFVNKDYLMTKEGYMYIRKLAKGPVSLINDFVKRWGIKKYKEFVDKNINKIIDIINKNNYSITPEMIDNTTFLLLFKYIGTSKLMH